MAAKSVSGGVRIVAALLLLVLGFLAISLLMRPRFDESEIRQRVVSAIQTDTAASFFVTGVLDLTATATVENTRYLIPPIRLNLGTTSATVRLPGRVAYGFDTSELKPEHVWVGSDGHIRVTIPALAVGSVEPNLEAMEVQTDVGWARTYSGSGQVVTREAMTLAQRILRQQAEVYLRDNTQPRINTAEALRQLLTPVLISAGVKDPDFSFQIAPGLELQAQEQQTRE